MNSTQNAIREVIVHFFKWLGQMALGLLLWIGIALIGICAIVTAKANLGLFAIIWVAIPAFACSLLRRSVSSSFTLLGLHRMRGVLTYLSIIGSFVLLSSACDYKARSRIAMRCVEGYEYWSSETVGVDKRQVNVSLSELAMNPECPAALAILWYAFLAAVFGLPAITLKATNVAWSRREQERFLTDEWKRVNEYGRPAKPNENQDEFF